MQFVDPGELCDYDDHLTHQTLDNHTRVSLSDPRWTERFIIEAHAPDGQLLLFTGFGIYPNTDYMDGFALVGLPGEQRNLRAGRRRSRPERDRFDLSAGPLWFAIEDPMRRWRLTCDEGDHGFAFDLVFTRRTAPYQMPTMHLERDGRLIVGYSHFVQAGRFDGWVDTGEGRITVEGWTGERDRSWGVRPASARVRRGLHFWIPIQFDDVSIWLWTHENETGKRTGLSGAVRPVGEDDPGPPVPVKDLRHDLQVDLVGHHRVLRSGVLEVHAEDGSEYEIEVRRDGLILGLIGGGYGGEHAQGSPKGEHFVAHDRWATTPDALPEVPHTILEHSVEFRWGEQSGRGDLELAIGQYDPKDLPYVD